MSLHPISDKAEVAVDFPDKAYIGSFGRHSQFDAYADDNKPATKPITITASDVSLSMLNSTLPTEVDEQPAGRSCRTRSRNHR
jgi:hypothetical protein